MNFTGTFLPPRINLAAYKKALQDELKEQLAFAVFQYLDAVLAKIPVWSGASAATFLALAKTVDFPLSIEPRGGPADGISFGRAHGTAQYEAGVKEGVFMFTYATTLAHLIHNEQFPPPGPGQFGHLLHPGPYHFRDTGKEAFDKVAQAVRLPSPFDYEKFRRIKVGK